MRRALLIATLSAGCVGATGVPETPLRGTEWVLVSLRGEAPAGRAPVTLRFDDEAAGGYATCNWYGGAYAIDGDEIEWKEMSGTARACADRSLMEQERVYLAALGEVRRFRAEGERLVLLDAGGAPLLEYARRHALPMDPADLPGTRWRLESIDGAAPVGARPITIEFADATTIRGFAGCRSFVSRYNARGDRIGLSATSMNETECDAPADVALQEGEITGRMSEAERYRLSGDRLEIVSASGGTLVFRREER